MVLAIPSKSQHIFGNTSPGEKPFCIKIKIHCNKYLCYEAKLLRMVLYLQPRSQLWRKKPQYLTSIVFYIAYLDIWIEDVSNKNILCKFVIFPPFLIHCLEINIHLIIYLKWRLLEKTGISGQIFSVIGWIPLLHVSIFSPGASLCPVGKWIGTRFLSWNTFYYQ